MFRDFYIKSYVGVRCAGLKKLSGNRMAKWWSHDIYFFYLSVSILSETNIETTDFVINSSDNYYCCCPQVVDLVQVGIIGLVWQELFKINLFVDLLHNNKDDKI